MVIDYFAYVSNLNKAQMKSRVGQWESSYQAKLNGYKLVFNCPSATWKCKTANIIKGTDMFCEVHGVIYRISQEQLDILTNEYEHVKPKEISVQGRSLVVGAYTYMFNPDVAPGQPSDKYLNVIITGLKEHGFPQHVIDSVQYIAKHSGQDSTV